MTEKEFKRFLLNANKVCKNKDKCSTCPYYNKTQTSCLFKVRLDVNSNISFSPSYINAFINIIENWNKANPSISYLQDLKNRFPNVETPVLGEIPNICRNRLYGLGPCCNQNCKDCWNEDME